MRNAKRLQASLCNRDIRKIHPLATPIPRGHLFGAGYDTLVVIDMPNHSLNSLVNIIQNWSKATFYRNLLLAIKEYLKRDRFPQLHFSTFFLYNALTIT